MAVLDENNKLVGNLSVTDFKLAAYQSAYWDYLGSTVKEYLKQLSTIHSAHIRSSPFYMVKNPDNPHQPVQLIVTVKPDDTLMTVVKYITFFRVHRVYIVNNEHKPVGLISCTDILKELLGFASQS